MKRILTTALAMLLVLASVLTLASCGSTFGTIKANFEKAGYELKEEAEKTIELTTDNGKLTVSVHTFQLKQEENEEENGLLGDILDGVGSLIGAFSTAMVYEFSTSADLTKALSENDEMVALFKDAQESEYVNGNCLLVTLNPDALKIFKGETEAK